jgi:hypothetical protein
MNTPIQTCRLSPTLERKLVDLFILVDDPLQAGSNRVSERASTGSVVFHPRRFPLPLEA